MPRYKCDVRHWKKDELPLGIARVAKTRVKPLVIYGACNESSIQLIAESSYLQGMHDAMSVVAKTFKPVQESPNLEYMG